MDYEGLPPNQMLDSWLPLQGVNKGEIHVKVTRKVPERLVKAASEEQPKPTFAPTYSGNAKLQRSAGKVCESPHICFDLYERKVMLVAVGVEW